MKTLQRPLVDAELVEDFLEGLFGSQDEISQSDIVESIYNAELSIKGAENKNLSTLLNSEYRSRKFKTDFERWQLRNRIVEELISKKRLEKDDEICLGEGGAMPHTDVQKFRQAYLITGLPASGKSGVASFVADQMGAAIVDSDYAKRKLPEYSKVSMGASLIHDESGAIVLGRPEFNETSFLTLMDRLATDGTNVVVPKIGDTTRSVLTLTNQLKAFGYQVHLLLIDLDRKKATIRAVHRFQETGRYVPLSLIHDVYANEPMLTYYRLRESHRNVFKSIGAISTDVPKGASSIYIWSEGEGSPALLFQKN